MFSTFHDGSMEYANLIIKQLLYCAVTQLFPKRYNLEVFDRQNLEVTDFSVVDIQCHGI